MSADSAPPVPGPAHADIRRLPTILKVTAARVRYPEPKTYIVGDAVAHAQEGVQVDIYTDEEFVARALSPVLYVGDHPLTESDRIGKNHYRFYGLAPAALQMKKGDPLRLAWSASPTGAKTKTTAHVKLPAITGD